MLDTKEHPTKIIFLADMESFYASVEVARNPKLKGKPVIVCGDPKLRHGIALAASKEAKAQGVKTAMPAWQCRQLCPQAVFVRPHMQTYIDVSLQITDIFQQYTDRVVPYSIDEQFLDVTGCQELFGPPQQMAATINQQVLAETGIRCRIGIGENPLQAKMACDGFAKKNQSGIFRLTQQSYAHHVWPLPIKTLFGVGSRMEQHLKNLGIVTIGDLAGKPKELLTRRWGVNGEVLWLNAHGIDYSIIQPQATAVYKGVGHSITLPRDYYKKSEIKVVLLELAEEVCRRARKLHKVGWVISVYCKGADYDFPTGFSRQRTLPQATAITMEVYGAAWDLFQCHWDQKPVRALGLGLNRLIVDSPTQLSIFDDQGKLTALGQVMDRIREQFGPTSLFRASSLSQGGQLFQRASKIGGHEA